MELEKFKQKDSNKMGIIIFTVACILLVSGVFFYTSFASFQTQDEFNIINGTVQDPGDIYFVYYVDNEITFDLPEQNSGYILDTENSNCTNGVIPNWNHSTWEFEGDYTNYDSSTNKQTKCSLYFVKTKTVETVLGELEVYDYTPDFTKSACDDEVCESHEKGIFETTDADGTSYYYRGSVENNYVYFANRYWRIIRINGDGTIRMIYDGTIAHDNGEISDDRKIGTSQFNPRNDDNMYVGYMYTSGDAHGLGTSSTIKQANDSFYTEVLSSYSSYIDTNAGFCGDRSTLNLQSGVGIGTITTYNRGYLRVVESDPNLICENENDLYTISSSNQGNKALQYPIGLITADEIILSGSSGGVFEENYSQQKINSNGYLTMGSSFWTMTPAGGYNPFGYIRWYSMVFYVNFSNNFGAAHTTNTLGLRSVINIKSDVTITGNGTKDNPYTIS